MLALTLRHPWPWAIVVLGKRIENRTWQPRPSQLAIGDWFAIHGGVAPKLRSNLEDLRDEAFDLSRRWPDLVPVGSTLRDTIRPGVVAVCRFGGVIDALDPESTDPWFEGPLGWVLNELVVLPEPVPCKGAQGLWELPESVLREVRRQFQEARQGPVGSVTA